MQVIKVKAYGIVELSKPQYLMIQLIGLVLLLGLLAAFYYFNMVASDDIIFGNLDLVVYVIVLLEAVETVFMLRKFKQKEQQASTETD